MEPFAADEWIPAPQTTRWEMALAQEAELAAKNHQLHVQWSRYYQMRLDVILRLVERRRLIASAFTPKSA